MQREHKDSEHTTREIAGQVCVRQQKESNSEEGIVVLVQHAILSGNQKLQYESEDKNTLTESQSSWTAISLAIQSRERARLDWADTHSAILIHTSSLTALSGRSGVLRSGERRSSWIILKIHLRESENPFDSWNPKVTVVR